MAGQRVVAVATVHERGAVVRPLRPAHAPARALRALPAAARARHLLRLPQGNSPPLPSPPRCRRRSDRGVRRWCAACTRGARAARTAATSSTCRTGWPRTRCAPPAAATTASWDDFACAPFRFSDIFYLLLTGWRTFLLNRFESRSNAEILRLTVSSFLE